MRLLCLNHGLWVVLGLVLNELAHTVPDADKPTDALLGGGRYRYRIHKAVFPEVQLSVHNGETKIPYTGVSRQGVRLLHRKVVQVYILHFALDLANGGSEQGFQALPLLGNTGGFHTVRAGHFLHLPQNHFRVGDKVGVHFQSLFIGVQMHPVRLQVGHTATLLQEQNVGSDRCTRSGLERIIGQSNGTEKVRPLGNVLSHRGIFLVHGALACNEGHHAAGAHLVQGTGKEIIVDQEIVLVVLLVQNLERPKGHVANGHIKEAVRQIGFFKSLYRNAVLLVQLLGNAPGNAVQFHTVHFGIFHILRQQTHEVAHAAAGFQDIAGLEAQIGQPLVHGPDHYRRGVERCQGRFPGGGVFVL